MERDERFSPVKLKPTWFSRSELADHVRSERTLVVPERGSKDPDGL